MEDLQKAIKEIADMAAVSTLQPAGARYPVAVVPAGYRMESLESLFFNRHGARPERIVATVPVYDADSFITYYQLFSDENSRVFADEAQSAMLAVLDYHAAGSEAVPRWSDHNLILKLRKSPEWLTWTQANEKKFTQVDFAEFMEQHASDVSQPTPATMREFALDLSVKVDGEFGASVKLQNGSHSLKYSESMSATSKVEIPDSFTLRIPVYIGGPEVVITGLIRFRTTGGKLSLWYTLIRPDRAEREAFTKSRDAIRLGLQVPIINGVINSK